MTGWAAAARVAVAILRRPALWPVALHQARTLAAPCWWRRPPYLPVPPDDYLHFRLVTAYGGRGVLSDVLTKHGGAGKAGVDPAADLVAYLGWCAQWRALRSTNEPGHHGHR